MGLLLRLRKVLDAPGNDDKLARLQPDLPVAQADREIPFHDEEELILGLVVVPDELSLEFHELHERIVDLAHDLGAPVVLKRLNLWSRLTASTISSLSELCNATPADDLVVFQRSRQPLGRGRDQESFNTWGNPRIPTVLPTERAPPPKAREARVRLRVRSRSIGHAAIRRPETVAEPLLLVPGPVPLAPEVLAELGRPALPHYGTKWVAAYREIEDLLRYAFDARRGEVFPIAGPGHVGLETLSFTFLRPGDRAVVVNNGFFGERHVDVLRAHHLKVTDVRSEWGKGPDLRKVRTALKRGARVLAVVHNETSTGLTNPLRELAELAHENDAFVLVDAVSSLAGLPLPFDAWGVEAAFAASQKGVGGPAGFAPVCVAPALFESVKPKDVDGWYANLFTWRHFRESWGKWHPQPTTISSNVYYAFLRALQLVREEGLEARIRRHREYAAAFRAGAAALGFRPLAPPEFVSNTVACIVPPSGVAPDTIQDRLRDDHGIFISGGLGPLHGKVLRIGTMATQATRDVLERLLPAMAEATGRRADTAMEAAIALVR